MHTCTRSTSTARTMGATGLRPDTSSWAPCGSVPVSASGMSMSTAPAQFIPLCSASHLAGRGVSPLGGRVHRLPRRQPLRGLLGPMDTIFDLRQTARNLSDPDRNVSACKVLDILGIYLLKASSALSPWTGTASANNLTTPAAHGGSNTGALAVLVGSGSHRAARAPSRLPSAAHAVGSSLAPAQPSPA
jgi:hypothetical protein